MNVDPTALAYGFVGLAAGTGANFWRRKAELQERCEFLSEMGEDLALAFEAVGDILSDSNTPKPIRKAILLLLVAHSDDVRGKQIALSLTKAQEQHDAKSVDDDNPILQSMEKLGQYSPALARKTHHALASLMFGLIFLNLADNIKVEKVKDAAAKDPATLWARIAQMFGTGNDHDHHEGGLLPV